jgi:putative membrane protein
MSRTTRLLPTLAAAAAVALAPAAATAASTASPSPTRSASGAKYAADRHWLKAIIQSDRAEIAAGKLAQQRGTTPAVRDLGAMLVADHAKHLARITKVARRLHQAVPTSRSPVQRWQALVLGGLTGAPFDAAWLSAQIADHQQDISDTQDEVTDGSHALLRNEAQVVLPTLRKHLKAAQTASGPAPSGG